ncbi:MAG: hypothetical protein L6308_06875, partial [Candidatus Omnitrophica bacterium]|nr:hypothetical protein [Candidatus Omnitrophota bacterium]
TVEANSTLAGTIDAKTATGSVTGTTGTLTRVLDGTETEGALTFSFISTDQAGNAGSANTTTTNSSSVTFDKTPPTAPSAATIVSGSGWTTNYISNTNKAAVKVSGTKSTDTTQIKIDLTDGTNTKTTTLPGLTTITTYADATGINTTTATALVDGNIGVVITAYDAAGNTSTQTITQGSGTIIKDVAVPNAPVISSIGGADNYINNAEKATIIVVGTAEAGSTINVSLSDVGNAHTVTGSGTATGGNYSITIDGTTLVDGTITPSVTSTDAAANVSSATATPTAIKDVAAPSSAATISLSYYRAATWDDASTVNGTSSDGGSGVSTVTIVIKNTTDNDYWTGSAWGSSTNLAVTSGTTTWTYTLDNANLEDGDSYSVTPIATDNAGNSTAGTADTFMYDVSNPIIANVSAPVSTGYTSLNALPSVFQGDVGDNAGGSGVGTNNAVFYLRKVSSGTSYYWNGSNWNAVTEQWLVTTHDAADSNNIVLWSDAIDLPAWVDKETYFVRVKAVDKAGNEYKGAEVAFYYDTMSSVDAVSSKLDAVSVKLGETTDAIKAQVSGVQTSVVGVKTETAKILTASETTIPANITKAQEVVTSKITTDVQSHVKSEILNRESVVKQGAAITIRYRTDSGLVPKISVYSQKDVLLVSSKTMTEIGVTGIYEYSVTFLSVWGLGDFTVICSEPTKGTIDALVISVVQYDIASVSGSVSAILGSTTGLTGLETTIGTIGAQFDGMDKLLTKISKDVAGKVGDTKSAVNDLNSAFKQLEEMSKQIKEMGGTTGINLEKLYEVSKDKKDDITYIKNKSEELKAAMEINKKLIEDSNKKPVVHSWFEFK